MKYVRTKNGIYEANSQIEPEKELQIKWIDDHCFVTSWKTKPCDWQVADTIEELCDGFIGVPDRDWFQKNCIATKGVHYFQKPFDLEWGFYKKDFANLKLKNQNGWEYTAIEWQRNHHCFIFGYIETDKGLIYVAKMNEKGELELCQD